MRTQDAGAFPDAGADDDAGIAAADAGNEGADAGVTCLQPEVPSPDDVDAGAAFLFSDDLGGAFMPRLAWDNLWAVWGGARPGNYAAAMRARYGFVEAATANDGLPVGLWQVGSTVHANCLVCHAGRVNGQLLIGAPNTRLDLQLLIDDLQRLAALGGVQAPNVPVRTGARGISDIVGMTMWLASQQTPPPSPVNTEIGYQDPPAWWTLHAGTRVYTDGSAPFEAHRTFLATQLAFGTTQAQLEALEPRSVQLRSYLLSLEPPPWPFAAPDADAVRRGQALFRQTCAGCHGDDRCARSESTLVPREDVGTDAQRSERYGPAEIDALNASWFGRPAPSRATGAYRAPALEGVWASAPYFHNGSVPTLEGVLHSAQRPAFFQLIDGYDEVRVGAAVQTFASAPVGAPRELAAAVYDTTQPGLGNGGHLYGDALTDAQRADLLAFLKTR